jgi:hypothetical protein
MVRTGSAQEAEEERIRDAIVLDNVSAIERL